VSTPEPTFNANRVFESRPFEGNAGPEQAARIKRLAGLLWDEIDTIPEKPPVYGPPAPGGYAPTMLDDPGKEPRRCKDIAKADLETAVMWAVKALSRHNGAVNPHARQQA
jgi:hypothetical protein